LIQPPAQLDQHLHGKAFSGHADWPLREVPFLAERT